MHLVMPANPIVGTVVSNQRCTAGSKSAGFVRHLAIDVSGTPLAGSYISGQSFGVIPPGVDSAGKAHKLRLYSIASPTSGEDGRGCVVATTVKRTIDEHHETHKLFLGVASNFLCDTHPGDQVVMTGPSGKRFVLPSDVHSHNYVFFATGTGIAPFRGMLMDLFAANCRSRIVLVMGSPYASDLLYHKELLGWQEQHTNFRYLTALSRERQSDGGPAIYAHDRIRVSRDEIVPVLETERTLVYICGIAGMELGVLQRLSEALSPLQREQYISVDPDAMQDVAGWTRRMLNKQLRPSRRVFMEVY